MHYLNQNYPLDHTDFPLLFDQLPFWSAPFGKWLLENVPMEKGMDVLDIGCGAGFPLIELAQRLGNSAKVTGLDIWKEAIERAQWKIDKMDLSNVKLVLDDAASMPFENERFDLIVSNLGINNFDEPSVVLQECHRVMKRNGKICITTNIDGHFQEFYTVFETALKESGLKDCLPALKANMEHRGNNEIIRNLFENAGFAVVKMLRDRIQLRYLDGSALLNHFLTVVGFLPAWKAILPKGKENEVFDLLEKKLNEQAEWDGELKMTVPMLYVEAVK